MEFREVVRKRRMVRHYTEAAVEERALERIVEAATKAPSAGFSQGQTLVVVTEPGLRRAIAALAAEDDYTARGFDPWLSSAPVHIVVCFEEEAYRRRYGEPDKAGSSIDSWPVSYPVLDAGASMMLLLLAAVDEGLAAGFFGIHRLDGLQELLGIPAQVTPIGIVTIGHPAPDRPSSSVGRGRRPFEEVVHPNGWRRPQKP